MSIGFRRAGERSPPGGPRLPSELEGLVTRALGRPGLTPAERKEIARELTAHFEEGLQRGCSRSALADAFGDVEAVATLIVRARRRARHPLLRAARIAVRAALALAVVTYAASAWRLHSTRPLLIKAAPYEPSERGIVAGDVVRMAHIRLASADLMNRVYSDDGAGNGRVSASGLRQLQALLGKSSPGWGALLLEPAFFALPASRSEASRELERIIEGAERRVRSGDAPSPPAALGAELALREQSLVWSVRNYPVAAIARHLSRVSPPAEASLARRLQTGRRSLRAE